MKEYISTDFLVDNIIGQHRVIRRSRSDNFTEIAQDLVQVDGTVSTEKLALAFKIGHNGLSDLLYDEVQSLFISTINRMLIDGHDSMFHMDIDIDHFVGGHEDGPGSVITDLSPYKIFDGYRALYNYSRGTPYRGTENLIKIDSGLVRDDLNRYGRFDGQCTDYTLEIYVHPADFVIIVHDKISLIGESSIPGKPQLTHAVLRLAIVSNAGLRGQVVVVSKEGNENV